MGTNEFATFEEVLRLCGVKSHKVGGNEVKVYCPACRGKSVQVSLTKGYGQCWGCGKRYNYQSYYAEFNGIDGKTARREIIDRLGRGAMGSEFVPPEEPEKKESPLASIEDRDAVYREVLKVLPLSPRHRKDLRKRGLTDEQIDRIGYRTYAFRYKSDRFAFASTLEKRGFSLEGIPGFYEEKGRFLSVWKKEGILVPYRDEENRLQGFQLRKNNELLEIIDGKEENKYDWFSSVGKVKGAPTRGFTHFACDFYYDFEEEKIKPYIGKELFLTEGAMKGDIIHALSGLPVIAVPGVKTLKELEKKFTLLRSFGVETIVDCFDMDYLKNPNVQKACEKVKEMIISAGFRYERKLWDPAYKGLDDFLLATKEERRQ